MAPAKRRRELLSDKIFYRFAAPGCSVTGMPLSLDDFKPSQKAMALLGDNEVRGNAETAGVRD